MVDGGMIKWLQENLPVESGEAPTPEVVLYICVHHNDGKHCNV